MDTVTYEWSIKGQSHRDTVNPLEDTIWVAVLGDGGTHTSQREIPGGMNWLVHLMSVFADDISVPLWRALYAEIANGKKHGKITLQAI